MNPLIVADLKALNSKNNNIPRLLIKVENVRIYKSFNSSRVK
jgi:hypothetical protein